MKKRNFKPVEEWFAQAEYDFETAEAMLKTGRYIYAVFMCHLSIEKALKGLYVEKIKENPIKTHNLNYLVTKANIKLSDEWLDFIDELNNKSVPTRYPDVLQKLLVDFKEKETRLLIKNTKELLICLKKKLKEY